MTPSPERRKYVRLEKNIPVKISSEDFDIVTETKNLSCAGAYCRVSKYIDPMTKLSLQLLVPYKKNNKIATHKVTCQGVIVRVESRNEDEGYNTAIFFNDIRPKDAKFIDRYVQSFHFEAMKEDRQDSPSA